VSRDQRPAARERREREQGEKRADDDQDDAAGSLFVC
jgi:hypothetical protein